MLEGCHFTVSLLSRGLLFTMLPKQSGAGSCSRHQEINFPSYLVLLEGGDSPRALEDLGVVLAVGAAEAVPPGEVEGAVEARVDVMQEVGFGRGCQRRKAHASCNCRVQPQRRLVPAVPQDVGPHLQGGMSLRG